VLSRRAEQAERTWLDGAIGGIRADRSTQALTPASEVSRR
jgi:hypothetical protein